MSKKDDVAAVVEDVVIYATALICALPDLLYRVVAGIWEHIFGFHDRG